MRRAIVAAGALVVVGIIIVVLIMPALIPVMNMGGDIYFTNADGQRVEIPFSRSFQTEGAEIVDLNTDVFWTVTGTNLKEETLAISAIIKIKMVDEYDQETLLEKLEFTSGEPEGTKLKSWLLSSLLPSGYDFWTLHITGKVTGNIDDVSGNPLSDSASFERWATISWYEETGTFGLTAGWA